MNYETIKQIIEIFNNSDNIVKLEKTKFVGDCHGDLFQFLLPLSKIIYINFNQQEQNLKIKILKNFKKPIVYYLGDLFSSNDNEMDFIIEEIVFQILNSSRIIKWIIGNHDIQKFNDKFIEQRRILNLIQENKIVLCDSFKGRLLSHTCFNSCILNNFISISETVEFSKQTKNFYEIIKIINNVFYNLIKEKQYDKLKNHSILWNRLQNDCFKSIVGHSPGLRFYLSFEDIDENLYMNIKGNTYYGELEILSFFELFNDFYCNNIEIKNENIKIKNIISECSTYKGRCKQIFKNNDILSTEDETDEVNKDNLKHISVIDFGCSYDKNNSKYGYAGISIPDYLYYDTCGIYKLTNYPIYIYLYTSDGIEIKEISKQSAFSHISSSTLINYIYIENEKPVIIKKRFCDASVYVYRFISEFENKIILLNFVSLFMVIILVVLIVLFSIDFYVLS